MPSPLWFHLLAGPNGAGKSTLYRALVREGILGPPLEFVNAGTCMSARTCST